MWRGTQTPRRVKGVLLGPNAGNDGGDGKAVEDGEWEGWWPCSAKYALINHCYPISSPSRTITRRERAYFGWML